MTLTVGRPKTSANQLLTSVLLLEVVHLKMEAGQEGLVGRLQLGQVVLQLRRPRPSSTPAAPVLWAVLGVSERGSGV